MGNAATIAVLTRRLASLCTHQNNSSQMFKKIISLSSIVFFTCVATSAIAEPVIVPAPPSLAADAHILMDTVTGKVLVESNADFPLPPASLTKMMTSYIVTDELERGRLKESDTVLITDDAWRRGGAKSGGSTMFLDPRVRVPVMDLLRGVIVQSGNDASIALAQHLAGSEEAFADVMNQHAQLLGMTNTHFVNATGWPAEGHVSTAKDMALLARAIIEEHPKYYPIYAEKYFTYNGINQPNRNRLLFRDPSIDGLKTGHTEEAGYGLVASAKKDGMRLVAAVMGTKSEEARAVETQKLLSYGFRYFQTHSLYEEGAELGQAKVWKGKTDQLALGVADQVQVTIPRGASDLLKAEISIDSLIEAPIEKGQMLGELIVSLEGETVYTADLVALESVEQAGFVARIWDSVVIFVTGLFK